MNDENPQIAWSALQKGTPVVTSDGAELGKVDRIVADEQKDIFSGVTFRSNSLDAEKFVPADLIDRLSESSVTLTVDADRAEGLEPYND